MNIYSKGEVGIVFEFDSQDELDAFIVDMIQFRTGVVDRKKPFPVRCAMTNDGVSMKSLVQLLEEAKGIAIRSRLKRALGKLAYILR